MTDYQHAIAAAEAHLRRQQRPDGGWGYHVGNTQAFVEPTAWAILALSGDRPDPVAERAVTFLLATQNSDGGWANVPGMESDMMTARAVMALDRRPECAAAVKSARTWIVRARLPDGGWGWCPGTTGFVETAAFAIVALSGDPRLRDTELADYVRGLRCADGGWCSHVPEKMGFSQSGQVSVTPFGVLALCRLGRGSVSEAERAGAIGLESDWVANGNVYTVYSLAMTLWCVLEAGGSSSVVEDLGRRAVERLGAEGSWNANNWHTAMMLYLLKRARAVRA